MGLSPVRADQPTIVSLSPMEITVPAPGENFTVAVNVTDVSGLAAWELKLSYNTTILDAVYVHRDPAWPEPPYTWTPKGTDLQFHPDGPPTINDTAGRVWVGCVIPFGSELTGNYTLVTIEFNATAMGNSTLHLYETALYDWLFVPIEHVTLDGSATVIPKPSLPLISVNLIEYTVLVGDSFTIDVNITDVTNLQDYKFELWFDNALLNATDVTPGPTNPPGTLFISDPLQNVSEGFVCSGASLPTGQSFNGSGILMTINFTALAAGECTLRLNETVLTDPVEIGINHLTVDGYIQVLPKTANFHTHHINDATDRFPNDYAPMVIPVNGKTVTIAPVITCTNGTCELGCSCLWKPNHHPCKLAQTLYVDDDWSDKDANYTYLFEDWTDYDWDDIVVSLYALTDSIINVEIRLEAREASWKNPFSVEITPEDLTIEIHWNSTDYPEERIVRVNSGETVDIELFPESNPSDISFVIMIPLIPPVASFVYSPLQPHVFENVTFNAETSTSNGCDIVSYDWNFGDGSLHKFGVVMTHHYSNAGTYEVTLNVTDSQRIWDTESKMITVTPCGPVGGHAVPITDSSFIAQKTGSASGIGLASVFSAAVAVTIILIRRRNKILRRKH